MPYTPQFNVFDPRAFADDVLAAIEDQQEDALAWAAGDATPLPNIAKFYNSAAGRLTTVFPSLMITSRNHATSTEDTLNIAVSLDFELMVSGGNADSVIEKSAVYAYVIESILQNTRPKSFSSNSAISFNGNLDSLETDFGVLRGLNAGGSSFLQITQIRAIWILTASAFTSAN